MRRSGEAQASARYLPESEASFISHVPKDTFVGFRIAFLDLETTALSALMGRLLVASIADCWGHVETRVVGDFPQSSPLDDSGLAEWVRDTIETFDIVTAWNGFNFDQSFLTARLLRWGKRPMRDMMAIDPMFKARAGRYGARIGSSKLENVGTFFRAEHAKPHPSWDEWQLAQMGDANAVAELRNRCEQDALLLRDNFNFLKPMIRTIHR